MLKFKNNVDVIDGMCVDVFSSNGKLMLGTLFPTKEDEWMLDSDRRYPLTANELDQISAKLKELNGVKTTT